MNSLIHALRGCLQHCRQSWYRLRLGQLGAESALSQGLTLSYPQHIAIDDRVSISPGATLRANTNAMPGISIGSASSIHEQCILSANQGQISIGSNCWLGPFCLIYGNGNVTIGNNVMIAAHSILNTVSHHAERCDMPMSDQGIYCDPVVIEDDVWIGMQVSVLQGVVIGKGSIIGAGSVVTRNIPPFSVAVGAPAKVIKQRHGVAEQL